MTRDGRQSPAEVTWSDDAIEAVVEAVALRTAGVIGLQPQFARRAISVTRSAGVPTGVVARIVTRIDPPPVETLRAFGDAVRAELAAVTGASVAVEATIVDVRA